MTLHIWTMSGYLADFWYHVDIILYSQHTVGIYCTLIKCPTSGIFSAFWSESWSVVYMCSNQEWLMIVMRCVIVFNSIAKGKKVLVFVCLFVCVAPFIKTF